jgi:flagellar hook-associated protein 3 FlgL
MTMTSIGDLSQYFISRQHNADLKSRLNSLTQEVSTGKASDMTAHLGADRARLADVDRRLSLMKGYEEATRDIGKSLSSMQVVLDDIEVARAELADHMIKITPNSSDAQVSGAGQAALDSFRDIVSSLNTRFGGSTLFAGTATDQPALASADAMLADLRSALAGAVTATDVTTVIDDWFDDPAGGFALMGYQGDSGAPIERGIDTGSSVRINARADDPSIKALLKATVQGALAADASLGLPRSTTLTLMQDSGVRLMSAAEPLTQVRADLGLAEERVELARTKHAAGRTAFAIIRNELTQVDPYDSSSALKEVQAQLETHYTVTARLSTLSLVEYLR